MARTPKTALSKEAPQTKRVSERIAKRRASLPVLGGTEIKPTPTFTPSTSRARRRTLPANPVFDAKAKASKPSTPASLNVQKQPLKENKNPAGPRSKVLAPTLQKQTGKKQSRQKADDEWELTSEDDEEPAIRPVSLRTQRNTQLGPKSSKPLVVDVKAAVPRSIRSPKPTVAASKASKITRAKKPTKRKVLSDSEVEVPNRKKPHQSTRGAKSPPRKRAKVVELSDEDPDIGTGTIEEGFSKLSQDLRRLNTRIHNHLISIEQKINEFHELYYTLGSITLSSTSRNRKMQYIHQNISPFRTFIHKALISVKANNTCEGGQIRKVDEWQARIISGTEFNEKEVKIVQQKVREMWVTLKDTRQVSRSVTKNWCALNRMVNAFSRKFGI